MDYIDGPAISSFVFALEVPPRLNDNEENELTVDERAERAALRANIEQLQQIATRIDHSTLVSFGTDHKVRSPFEKLPYYLPSFLV